MKEYLAELVRSALTPLRGRNVAREYLQARILSSLQRAGAMIPLAFHGGTALRFLYSLPRYSEDLDFALERQGAGYDFRAYLNAVRADFSPEGYSIDLKVSDRKTVHNAFVRFRGLPFELGLSAHPDETLAVKIEVDTDPPGGARLATTIVRRHVLLNLQHHDRASLFSGKIHAILQRSFTKGRDIYDLLWYLSDPDWPSPNLAMLNNAPEQTGWQGPQVTVETWRTLLAARLEGLDWDRLLDDVRPFLEVEQEENLLTLENFRALLRNPV
jgi:hypothetical protein